MLSWSLSGSNLLLLSSDENSNYSLFVCCKNAKSAVIAHPDGFWQPVEILDGGLVGEGDAGFGAPVKDRNEAVLYKKLINKIWPLDFRVVLNRLNPHLCNVTMLGHGTLAR